MYTHFILSESQTIAVWFDIADNIAGAYVSIDADKKYNGFLIPEDQVDKVIRIFERYSDWLFYDISEYPLSINQN